MARTSTKKVQAEVVEEATESRVDWMDLDADAIATAHDEDEQDWNTIAKELEVGRAAVQLAYMRRSLPKKEQLDLRETDEDEAAKVVIDLRGDELSWGWISARTALPESRCRALFTLGGGGDHKGNRIGNRGRPLGEGNGETTKAPKQRNASEAALNPGRKHLADMNLAELKERLTGQTATVGRNGKPERILVKSVTKLVKGEVSLQDGKGKSRVIAVGDIVRVTSKAV